MTDVLAAGLCRRPGADPRWWDHDASDDAQRIAGWFCVACPVLEQCAADRFRHRSEASGTWAGVFWKWRRTRRRDTDDVSRAFGAVFGAEAHNGSHGQLMLDQVKEG